MTANPHEDHVFAIRPDALAWAKSMEARSRSPYSSALVAMYRVGRMRRTVLRVANRVEGGRFFSHTLRACLEQYHRVTVGAYSYGPCLTPGAFPAGTIFGNYCSIGPGVTAHRRNHPADRLSLHPFFYNASVGLLTTDSIERVESNPLMIGSDAWIGEGAIFLPRCRAVGDGAIVGAGSVVTRDVEPFTIVAGNPAKIIKRRFSPEVERAVIESRWWERTLPELLEDPDLFAHALGNEHLDRLLRHAHASGKGDQA